MAGPKAVPVAVDQAPKLYTVEEVSAMVTDAERANVTRRVAALQAKIAELDKQRVQHVANANACLGAMQLAQAQITDLEAGNG